MVTVMMVWEVAAAALCSSSQAMATLGFTKALG
jgi:hypothetical protein